MVRKAAVIGLGGIGFRLGLDPLRKATWSHVAAYEKSARTCLSAAAEIDDTKIEIFRSRHKNDIPVFRSVEELMEKSRPEIVSICTPTPTHGPILKKIARYPVKAIFCEKPIAPSAREAGEMVKLCAENGIALAVNHWRRWDSNYIFARRNIREGGIGRVRAVHAFYTNKVYNIGTHLFDAIRMLIEKDAVEVSGLSSDPGKSDPAVSGWIRFEGGLYATVISTGRREDLIFEIDVIGDGGRIRVVENGARVERFKFLPSRQYSGYREPYPVRMSNIRKRDGFVDAVDEIVSVIDGKKKSPSCSGRDGLEALSMAGALHESSKKGRKVCPD
jgi:predicted dehydrogenase